MLDNLDARSIAQGRIELACLPAALDHYAAQLDDLFAYLGKPLQPDELQQVRGLLQRNLLEGFRAGSGAKLVVQYEITVAPTLKKNLALNISHAAPTMSQEFQGWAVNKPGPLFGQQADARVIDVADQLAGEPRTALDLGAGTGRNALDLARRGWQVDAVEQTPSFVQQIQSAAAIEQLPVKVIEMDLFDLLAAPPRPSYRLVVLSEVVSHFRNTDQLGKLFERVTPLVPRGGRLVFNAFLAEAGWKPSSLVREMAEAAWASLFTRDELQTALGNHPWKLLTDDAVYDYERQHLPAETWPPRVGSRSGPTVVVLPHDRGLPLRDALARLRTTVTRGLGAFAQAVHFSKWNNSSAVHQPTATVLECVLLTSFAATRVFTNPQRQRGSAKGTQTLLPAGAAGWWGMARYLAGKMNGPFFGQRALLVGTHFAITSRASHVAGHAQQLRSLSREEFVMGAHKASANKRRREKRRRKVEITRQRAAERQAAK